MKARLMLLLAALATSGSWAPAANAAFDPTHAQADVDAAMREKAYPFCRAPHEPLSSEARALCGQATSVPGCEGFSAACARLEEPASPPSWLGWLKFPPFLGELTRIFVWLLVGILVVAILIPIARGLAGLLHRGKRMDRRPDPMPAAAAVPEAPIDAAPLTDEEQILARADRAAVEGNFGVALQLYLLASLRALDRRGALRIARDRTNGEYVRTCSDTTAKPVLRDVVREVDLVQFGRHAPTRDAVMRAASRAAAIVRAVPLAMLVVVLLGCLGCGGVSLPKPRQDGDDPAGHELLGELLRRQGVGVKGLSTSLATMPLPAPGARAPAVLVDVESTALDEETSAHLVSWVKAGGVLVLAGSPLAWPHDLEASPATATGSDRILVRRLLARAIPPEPGEAPSPDDSETAIFAPSRESAALTSPSGVTFKSRAERVAWFEDGTVYAAARTLGTGYLVGVATDELLTNVGLARPGNAAALVALLASASRNEIRLAQPEDGVAPPSTPLAALLRAGLGLGLAHAAVFAVVLFLAAGARLRRPRTQPPARRRAFVEHVEAVGTLYAKTRQAAHALAAYARFADERLRARMPRATGDVAAFLASRAGAPLEVCQRTWHRATEAKGGAPPQGDELAVLRELEALCAAALARD